MRLILVTPQFEFVSKKFRESVGSVTLDRQTAALRWRIRGKGTNYNETIYPQRF